MNKNKRIIAVGLSLLSAAVTLVLGVTTVGSNFANALFNARTNNDYRIVLDSSNKVTSSGDVVQHTKLGNEVTFTYSGVSGSPSGHVTLNANGTLVNKDHIRSIQSVTAVTSGSGTLKFRLSYGGDVWNEYVTVESGYKFDIGSNPYYIEFKAFNNPVTISSIELTYSCVQNSSAHEGEEAGEGLLGVIDFWNINNAGNTNTNTLVNLAYVTARSYDSDGSGRKSKTLVSAVSDASSYTYQDRYGGIGLSSSNYGADFVLTLAEGIEAKTVTVITGSQNSNQDLILNDVEKTVTADCTNINALNDTFTNTLSWEFDAAQTTLEFQTYKKAKVALYKIYLYGAAGPSYDSPESQVYENGFNATDSKANSYKTSDSYDTANGLSVYATDTDGGHHALTKGDNGYSYVIKNSNDQIIDSSQPFGGEDDGTYTVTVSYKNYIPVVINISVEYVVALTKIEVKCSTISFNTAQKLSDYTNEITADLTYNKASENVKDLAYGSFASKNVALTLIKPNGLTHSINEYFGVAGDDWKIRVSSTVNPAVYGDLIITVSAIPVTKITVSASSTELEEGSKLQLTVAVTPNNATNQNVTWSSSHEGVATVSSSGEVTAVSSSINNGQTRITATAVDGSQIFGYIDITVTAKPEDPDIGTYSLLEGTLEVGSYVVFASTSSNGDAYVAAGQSGNIRLATTATISSSKIEKTSTSNFRAFLVGEGKVADSYSFYDPVEEEYICATSSGSNYVGTQSTLDNNGSWKISGSSSATITAQGNQSRNTFKYNYNGGSTPRFTCYAPTNTTQTLPAIFVKAGKTVYPTALSVSASESSIAVGETSQLTVGYEPSNTTFKAVSYSSGSESVATVDATGLVTGVGEGTAEITVTGFDGEKDITAKISITVTYVYVTSVSITASKTDINVGETLSLNAIVSPSDASNKNVTWSSNDADVATISSSGVVTAKAAGDVTITVTTVDTKSDKVTHATNTIQIHISSSGGGVSSNIDVIDNAATKGDIGSGGTTWNDFTINGASGAVYTIHSMGLSGGSHALQWNKNGYLYTSTSNDSIIESIKVDSNNAIGIGLSNSVLSSDNTGSETTTIASGTYTPEGEYEYLRIWGTTSSTRVNSIEITYSSAEPIDPTDISLTPETVNVVPGGSKHLFVSYAPINANQNLDVDWSSNSSKITVDENGKITASNDATVGSTAIITARLHNLSTIFDQCTVTVIAPFTPKKTIMIYMCGSDLESGAEYDDDDNFLGTYDPDNGSQGTQNIGEILSVADQPDDVNIIIETGGAKRWWNNYGMNTDAIERWHVESQHLVQDASLTRTNMAASSTFQSFMEWGLEYYPAQETGVILWDHGNGMQGCCSDEWNTSWDMLTENEVKSALTSAYSHKNVSGKLDWIGYDCCLMAMQDIASINADFFNYQISSQESEPGAGWDYDGWVASLYQNSSITTVNLLKSICDTYKVKVRETYDGYAAENPQKYGWYADFEDTTLAIFDLSYMDAYVSAWETMVGKLKITDKTKFDTLAGYAKECYAFSNATSKDLYGPGTSGVDAYDAYTFLNLIDSNYSGSTASTVKTKFNNVVIYKVIGFTYTNHAYGMSVFVATYGQAYADDEYTTSDTKFTSWRTINLNYGTWLEAE